MGRRFPCTPRAIRAPTAERTRPGHAFYRDAAEKDMSENHLRSALGRGEFVCSAELVRGRDHATDQAERFVCEAAAGGPVRVISVTDLPGGNPALPPDAFVATIVEHGLTPIAHLTGKDANRALIEGRLHAFARAGVENILALTGDVQRDGWAGAGKPVHD